MRFSCTDVFRWCFCAGVGLGGAAGILLSLMDRSVGLTGGMFLGLVFGLVSGLFAVVYAAIFNVLSPHFGGLRVRLEPTEPAKTAGGEAPAAADSEPVTGPGDTPVKEDG